MTQHPLILADCTRAAQFHRVGSAPRLLRSYASWTDPDGISWAAANADVHRFAVAGLGPGWIFDPLARRRWETDLIQRQQSWARLDETGRAQTLQQAVARVRLGRIAERLLWAIHQRVLHAHASVVRLSDVGLGTLVWGKERSAWPAHWRTELFQVLDGLTWLHVAAPDEKLGAATALFTHVGDLRGQTADVCDADCPMRGGPLHHHFLVNIGRGFLGILEQFAGPEKVGVRTYDFPLGRKRSDRPGLRKVGRSGQLVSVYLPALLGAELNGSGLTRAQIRLLQAIVRETTRAQHRRGVPSDAELFTGNRVPALRRGRYLTCPELDARRRYVGFNGNRKRKGLGYRLCTPGGWLAKAGYQEGRVSDFLGDLGKLATVLGLTVASLDPQTGQWLDLAQMSTAALTLAGLGGLKRLHLRIYGPEDYLARWNAYFGWPVTFPTSATPEHENGFTAQDEMRRKGIGCRALARGLRVEASFVSRLMNGQKPWPPALRQRAESWIAAQVPKHLPQRAAVPLPSLVNSAGSLLPTALAYLQRGWSVVPQLPGAKKPCVRWKPFQKRQPTPAEMTSWFKRWPNAGLAVVLGPVSGLFVIDVDGPEAHAALLHHLGHEPLAPKALSGSRAPCRYHLFFACPDVLSKAKATPWHDKLEFRGQGGIVVLPPSLHKSGNRYEWAPGQSLNDLALPPVPAPVLEALTPAPRPTFVPGPATDSPEVDCSFTTRQFLSGAYFYSNTCDLDWSDRFSCNDISSYLSFPRWPGREFPSAIRRAPP